MLEEIPGENAWRARLERDVRDAMRAYWVATTRGRPGEAYNIGGTTTMKVGEFLEMLKSLASRPIPTRVDPALLRPADVTLQIPCCDKFVSETGWKPQCTFEDSVKNLLDYWRSRAEMAAMQKPHGTEQRA